MSAFNFPSPPVADGTEVTNSATGVTYKYDASADSWNIVSTEIATDINSQVSQLSADVARIDGLIVEELETRDELIDNAVLVNENQDERIQALESADGGPALTYMLGTDKNGNPLSTTPAIELVDSDDSFSNVKFEATGGLTVSSSASSIIFDGSNIDVDLDDYYTKAQVDAADQHLQDQVNELLITKGVASVYTLNDIGIIVGIRPGDFYIDNTVAKNVSFITLAPVDDNGNERPIGAVGDILELVKSDNTTYRYEISTAAEGVAGVQFQTAADPDDLLIPGMTFSVYIYPQNKASASIDYVDARHEEAKAYTDSVADEYLPLAGGEMTGSLNMNGAAINTNALVKSTRTSGYAFQVYDEANDSNPAFIHSNGNIRGAQGIFTDTLEVREAATFKKTINTDGNVNSNGGWVAGNWGIETNGKGMRWYSSDRNNHLADITFQTDKLETLIYDDYLWTLKVQNSGNTDNKVLIYGDYSSGLILNEVGELNTNGNINLGGNLVFTSGGMIDATSGNPVLSGRASLDIKTAADYPIVISSGSSYKKVLAIYGFDGNQDDNRGETAYINANGNAYFKTVYSNDEELATQTYVDDMGQIYYGNIVPAGSDVNDGDLWVDSGNMRLLMRASGAWVNPDREADTDDLRKYIAPNGRKFGFSSGTGTVTGKLNYYDSGGLKLRLSNTDSWGVKWNDGGITEDVTMSSGPYFTIWEWLNDSNHKMIRQGRISRIDYHANDILCHISSHRTNGGFSTAKNYWVTIGGII